MRTRVKPCLAPTPVLPVNNSTSPARVPILIYIFFFQNDPVGGGRKSTLEPSTVYGTFHISVGICVQEKKKMQCVQI